MEATCRYDRNSIPRSSPWLCSFEVTFTDGLVVTFDYDADVEKEIGSLYEKYP